MQTPILTNVFFWALVATVTMFLEVTVFTSRRSFDRWVYATAGTVGILGFGGPRALIPFLPQPSLGIPSLVAFGVGGVIFVVGVAIILGSLYQLRKASRRIDETRRGTRRPVLDTGLYGIVRHPMYLGDILWALGLGIACNAAYAVAITPVWWLLRAALSVLEEDRLIDKHGESYRAYRERVPNRILPLRR